MTRITLALGSSAALIASAAALAQTSIVTGPSSSATPYVRPVGSKVTDIHSIITVGDTAPNGYLTVGIMDGMGAYMAGNGTMDLFIDHELTATAGNLIQRAHQTGTAFAGGAFISKWNITTTPGADFLRVNSGADAMLTVATTTNGTGGSLYNFARFCSGDVPEVRALFNAQTGLGSQNRFFVCGEESGTPGRMIATDLNTGVVYQMPAFDASQGSWENGLARPFESDQTVVIGLSDGGANRVFVYVGTKQATGNPAERAGLMNGTSYGIQVRVAGTAVASESRTSGFNASGKPAFSGTFTLATGGTAAGTTFLRPEDGAWDPANPADFYFVTTDRMSTTSGGAAQSHASRLYRLRFSDVNNVLAGGTIEALLDGTDVMEMGDNLAVYNDLQGGTRVMLQEDPGGHPHSAKTLLYTVATDTVEVVMQSDTARFGAPGVPATAPFNQDEENSGVFDARDTLGLGWFVGNMQAHYLIANPIVEGGQLYAFFCPECVGSTRADLSATLDGVVGGDDIAVLLGNWGGTGRSDINRDGTTNGDDLAALLAAWDAN
jgi:hypothetical protein